ncbi:hypothetical protein ACFL52_00070 [Candidatus Margulisiibacteriota bacterium]
MYVQTIVANSKGKSVTANNLHQYSWRYDTLSWQPVKQFTITDGAQRKTVEIFKASDLCNAALDRLLHLWNDGWKPPKSICGDKLEEFREALLVTKDQIKKMQKNSAENIYFSVIDGKIEGAIWGLNRDFPVGPRGEILFLDGIEHYEKTTCARTFEKNIRTGKNRLCVSVVYNGKKYGKYRILDPDKNEMTDLHLGNAEVITALIDTACDPYQDNIFAYSRFLNLNKFTQLVLGLWQGGPGIRVKSKDGEWWTEYGDKKLPVQVEAGGIKIKGEYGESLVDLKSDLINPVTIIPTEKGYFIPKVNVMLLVDEIGVYINSKEGKDYLVNFKDYAETDFDGIVRFHKQKGGVPVKIIPGGRRDPSSLDVIVVFHYPFGMMMESKDLYNDIYKRLSPMQKIAVLQAINNPDDLEQILLQRNELDLYYGFSVRKLLFFIRYVRNNNNQKMLLNRLLGKNND